MKLDSELQMCFFYATLSVLCPPSTSWNEAFFSQLLEVSPRWLSFQRLSGLSHDEIFKGVNPVLKLLERLRAATALVRSVTALGLEKDQWNK